MQYNNTNKTFVANGAIAAHTLVKLEAAGTIATAGAGDAPIGVAMYDIADGVAGAVALLNQQGTVEIYAAAAITNATVVYGKASGYIDDGTAAGDYQVGVAMEAATAAGDIIEVMPIQYGAVAT